MTNNSTAQFRLPPRLGIAADLCFSVPDHVGYLADCLLVHDEVVIPLSASVLNRLEAAFDTEPIRILLREKRIRFCPSYSLNYARNGLPEPYSRDSFMGVVRSEDFFKNAADRNDLFSEIEATFIDPVSHAYSDWLGAGNDVNSAFAYYENRSGYEFLFPSERFYYQTGAFTGVARINDLLVAGVAALEMDQELPQLLELCFPIRHASGVSPDADRFEARKIVEDLHSLRNLPTFEKPGYLVNRPQDEIEKIIKAVLSDEAKDLRDWLSKHISADLDVRSAYASTEKLLPSKKSWTNWARFGVSTGISTVTGMLLAGPAGAVAGAAIGAADLVGGGKIAAMFDGYHPSLWLSHVQNSGLIRPI